LKWNIKRVVKVADVVKVVRANKAMFFFLQPLQHLQPLKLNSNSLSMDYNYFQKKIPQNKKNATFAVLKRSVS
jgi:hypothetical protein